MAGAVFFYWYNAYFEVQFQLQKLADGDGYAAADRIPVINDSHILIKHVTIKSFFTKNLLEYSDDYSRSVAKNSFRYLITDAGFGKRKLLTQAARDDAVGDGGKNINVLITLNRYSFFEELAERMLVPMQLQFERMTNSSIRLQELMLGVLSLKDSIYGY